MSSKKTTTTIISRNNVNSPKPKKVRSKRKSSLQPMEKTVIAPVQITRVTSNYRPKSFLMPPQREFISNVQASTSSFAQNQTLIINPGNQLFSNWASKIASCFESYRFRKLKFIYIPRTSTSTGGFVALSPDCNPKDPAPASEFECFQNSKTKDGPPWKEFSVVFDSEMLNKRKSHYCRKSGAVPLSADIDLYDIGNLFVCVGGQQSTPQILGQIWVEYEVEFFTPEYSPLTNVQQTRLQSNNSAISTTSPLGGQSLAVVQQVGDFIQSITNDGTGDVITFARDFHGLLNLKVQGQSMGAPTISDNGSGSSVNMTENGFNPNLNIGSSTGTFGSLESLIKAAAGQQVKLAVSSGNSMINSFLTMTPCFL